MSPPSSRQRLTLAFRRPRTSESAMNDMVLQSALTCPRCGAVKQETMPEDACVFFYECPACKELLRPDPGDCCVFCSFGSVACPPKQQESNCCQTSQGAIT